MGTLIIDPHNQLAAAWKQAINAAKSSTVLQRLAAMPMSEDKVQRLIEEGRW